MGHDSSWGVMTAHVGGAMGGGQVTSRELLLAAGTVDVRLPHLGTIAVAVGEGAESLDLCIKRRSASFTDQGDLSTGFLSQADWSI